MKKIIISLSLMLSTITSLAYDVCVDGIYYNLISKGKIAEVTNGDKEYSGSVSIPSSIEYNGISYSVTRIGASAFFKCMDLNSIAIPNSITSIGSGAFYGCSNLTSITIPNSVTSIGKEAFENCNLLQTITIPDTVTEIKYGTFGNCTSLTSIVIGKSIVLIGDLAFFNCKNLETVTCFAKKVPDSFSDSFKGAYIEYCTLIVPEETINDYKATAPWNEFGTIKTIESTSISDVPYNITTINAIIDLDGKETNQLNKGINIVRTEDRKTKKVIIK